MSVVIAECITSNYWIHSLGCGKNATIWQPCRTSLPSDRSSAKSNAIWKCRAGELLCTRCFPERGKVFIHLRFLFASLPFFTELILTVLFSGIFCSFYLTILKFCLLIYCIIDVWILTLWEIFKCPYTMQRRACSALCEKAKNEPLAKIVNGFLKLHLRCLTEFWKRLSWDRERLTYLNEKSLNIKDINHLCKYW